MEKQSGKSGRTLNKSIATIPFVRFLFVGGINTVFGYSLYALFLYLHFHYSIAVLCSTVIAIFFNFITVGKIVFNNVQSFRIARFCCVYVLSYFINIASLKLLLSIGFNAYSGGAVVIIPLAYLTFVLHRRFVFFR